MNFKLINIITIFLQIQFIESRKLISDSFLKCHQCNSSIDLNCEKINPLDTKFLKECADGNSIGCFTSVEFGENDKKVVIRGCRTQSFVCKEDSCTPCEFPGCNKKDIQRVLCYKCESSSNLECTTYDKNISNSTVMLEICNACGIKYEDHKIVRGCFNSKNNAPNEKKCTEDKCNNYIKEENWSCHKCEDKKCFEERFGNPDSCNIVKDVCFIHVEDDKTTKRGCLSEDGEHLCGEMGEMCFTCDANHCNSQKAEHSQSCYTCDGTISCLTPAATEAHTIFINRKIKCFTKISDNKILRGKLETDNEKECDDDPNCFSCDGDLCNEIIIEETKLKCIICKDGKEACEWGFDVNDAIDCEIKINFPDHKSQCYIKKYNNGSVSRGCTLDDLIISDDSNTKLCQTDGCNNEHIAQCIICDSSSETNCTLLPETLIPKNCSTTNIFYKDRGCFSQYEDYKHVTRGCFADLDDVNRNACARDVRCSKCDGSECNNNKINFNDICVECDEEENPNCRNSLDDIPSIPSENKDAKGCYLKYDDNNKVKRGFAVKLPKDELKSCLDPKNEKCKICNEAKCNEKLEFQKCFACDSKNINVSGKCIMGNELELENLTVCEMYMDSCISFVDKNGYTIRGCKNELPESDNADYKQTCVLNLCNNYIYPKNRLFCYKCEESDDKCQIDPSINSDKLSILCLLFKPDDKCFTFYNKIENRFSRGCNSDNPKCNATKLCNYCTGSNCNKEISQTTKPSLTCIKCKNADKCKYGFLENEAENCIEDVKLGNEEKCYTTVKKDNTVDRGCLLDDELECLSGDESCPTCLENHCNINNIIRSECVQCNSANENEDSCAETAEGIQSLKCPDMLETFEDRGCFTLKKEFNVIRGCIQTLEENDREYCKNEENKKCSICFEKGCNNKVPSVAAAIFRMLTFSLLLNIVMCLNNLF